MDLVAIVLNFGEFLRRLQIDLDGFREDLLPRQHDRVLNRCIYIAAADLRRMRTSSLEEISQYPINLRNFETNVFDHSPRRTRRWKIATDDFDHPSDARKGIANFVRQSRSQLTERRQVLGPRHLRTMQKIDLFPAVTQLLHHVVKIASEVSDFIVALCKAYSDVEIAFAH